MSQLEEHWVGEESEQRRVDRGSERTAGGYWSGAKAPELPESAAASASAAAFADKGRMRQRIMDALRVRIGRGQRVGKVRYGFDLGPDGKSLVPNAVEQAGIALMRKLRAEGNSYV